MVTVPFPASAPLPDTAADSPESVMTVESEVSGIRTLSSVVSCGVPDASAVVSLLCVPELPAQALRTPVVKMIHKMKAMIRLAYFIGVSSLLVMAVSYSGRLKAT